MFKAVTDVYMYMYIYKCEYKCLCSKEINVQGFPVLLSNTHYEYHFVSMICISYSHICFSSGVPVALNEIFVYIGTHLPNRLICSTAMARITRFTVSVPAKT